MSWRAYKVVFRLRSPLHIGWRKVGNLQLTRPYVPARTIWGALTARLTRDCKGRTANGSSLYEKVGRKINQYLAFTYFYPALFEGDKYRVFWPWEDESYFRYRFLSSYVSTALAYPEQSAAEGSLHEVEFLSPYTTDSGEQVFLLGYIFERNGCELNWRDVLSRLQLGGERSYGWGKIELGDNGVISWKEKWLFSEDGRFCFDDGEDRPRIIMKENSFLPAHAEIESGQVQGQVEPLVSREWVGYTGEQIKCISVAYVPGSTIRQKMCFEIGDFGLLLLFQQGRDWWQFRQKY